MTKTKVSNPGSDAARDLGCRCPVLDNAHGRGAWGSEGPDAVFWISESCKLHTGNPKSITKTVTAKKVKTVAKKKDKKSDKGKRTAGY